MKYKVLTLLFAFVALTACVDDELLISTDNNDMNMFTDGYSLNLMVTLDNMGGTRAADVGSGADFLDIEDYIDPEKFRVLFFDREDRFLFESKSRWVKQLAPSDNGQYSQWLVSVPLYSYGNDEKENWNWDEIVRVLTGDDLYDKENGQYIYTKNMVDETDKNGETKTKPASRDENGKLLPAFKVAILVNRPVREWNMGINGRDASGTDFNPVDVITAGGWEIENGPNWTKDNARWGTTISERKEVFDLHHCQLDAIYEGKQWYDRGQSSSFEGSIKIGNHYYKNYGIYNFISHPNGNNTGLMGGATSTWVDWGNGDTDSKWGIDNTGQKLTKNEKGYRKFSPPTKEHPIPMYGIQEFNPIEHWVKGTPFNLSLTAAGQEDYDIKQIALLRSVVKLELVMPLGFDPDWVLMFYPNIYARCEPMDVWTPTDILWEGKTHEGKEHGENEDCEWFNIKKYGAISRKNDPSGSDTDNQEQEKSVRAYQQRLSWFYGAWKEKGWEFKGLKSGVLFGDDAPEGLNDEAHYPRIFNSCIQRNTAVFCDKEKSSYVDSDGKVHYVVYTGERNVNDPSAIVKMGADKSGAPTITYWMFEKNNNLYSIALADFDNKKTIKSFVKKEMPAGIKGKYPVHADSGLGSDGGNTYEQAVQEEDVTKQPSMPWPLMRNHVYSIEIQYEGNVVPEGPIDIPVTWDFTNLSTETTTNLDSDNTNWNWNLDSKKEHEKGWGNLKNLGVTTQKELMAIGTPIRETEGLKFRIGNDSDNRFNFEYDLFDSSYPSTTDTYKTFADKAKAKYYLRLEGSGNDNSTDGGAFTFPKLPKDCYITVVVKIPVTGNSDTDRYIYCSQGDVTYVQGDGEKVETNKYYVWGQGKATVKKSNSDYKYVFTWKVNSADKKVQFQIGSNKGLAFEKFRVTKTNPWESGSYVDNDTNDVIVGKGYGKNNGTRAFARESSQSDMVLKTDVRYSKSLKLDQPHKVK